MNAIPHPLAAERQSDFAREASAALDRFVLAARQRIAELGQTIGHPISDAERIASARLFGRAWRDGFALDVDELLSAVIESADDGLGVLSREGRKDLSHIVSDAGVECKFNDAADLLDMGRAA